MALPVVLLIGCSMGADNQAGFEYTGRGPSSILSDTLTVTGTDTTWMVDLSLEESPRLFVGEFGGYEAAALIRFADFPVGAQVVQARLIFRGVEADASGDSTDTIDLSLYRVTAAWDSSWTGKDLPGLSSGLGELLAEAHIPLSAIADTFSFSMPADLLQSWVDDAASAARGVALMAASPAPFFLHLDSAEALRDGRPKLKLRYVPSGGGNVREEELTPAMDLSLVTFADAPTVDELWVGRGTPYRTLLTFDVSHFPTGITVNRAVLRLGVRQNEAVTDGVAIVAALPLSQEPWYLMINETMTPGTTSYSTLVALSDSTASLVVTSAAAAHFPKNLPQLGLMLVAVGEGSGIGMIKLWDSTAESQKLARLEIIYSLPSGMTP